MRTPSDGYFWIKIVAFPMTTTNAVWSIIRVPMLLTAVLRTASGAVRNTIGTRTRVRMLLTTARCTQLVDLLHVAQLSSGGFMTAVAFFKPSFGFCPTCFLLRSILVLYSAFSSTGNLVLF